MSTRSLVARATGQDTFVGRYVHFDGYPSGVGRSLWNVCRRTFEGDADRMLASIIDDNVGGIDDIDERAFREGGKPVTRNGKVDADEYLLADAQAAQFGCEYAYVFDRVVGSVTMRILKPVSLHDESFRWNCIADLPLDGPEPDWTALDDVR